MSTPNKHRAFCMAGSAFVAYFVTSLIVSLAMRYAATGVLPSVWDEFNNIQLSWETFLISTSVLFILIGLGGLVINALFKDDKYFGPGGALRWGLFGAIEAIFEEIFRSLGSGWPFILREIIELALVPISYSIAFKLIPFRKSGND